MKRALHILIFLTAISLLLISLYGFSLVEELVNNQLKIKTAIDTFQAETISINAFNAKMTFADLSLTDSASSSELELHLDSNSFHDLKSQLGELLPSYLRALEIGSGTITGLQKNNVLTVDIDSIAGAYSNVLFTGTTAKLMYDRIDNTLASRNLKIEDLNAGIKVYQTEASLTLVKNTLTVTKLKSRLLGGVLTGSQIIFNPASKENRFPLQLSNIDLAEITKLLSQDSLTLTGRVSGVIPLTLDSQGLHTEQGKLQSEKDGGIIRYTAAPLSGDPVSDLVWRALRNFHYSSLTAQVNYRSNGESLIEAKLLGKNPDLNNGQSINVNINVEQNILSLLKSLQARSDIEKKIERFYK